MIITVGILAIIYLVILVYIVLDTIRDSISDGEPREQQLALFFFALIWPLLAIYIPCKYIRKWARGDYEK